MPAVAGPDARRRWLLTSRICHLRVATVLLNMLRKRRLDGLKVGEPPFWKLLMNMFVYYLYDFHSLEVNNLP